MIRARTLISIAVALALVLALMPTMALADTGGSTGGSFTAGADDPTVDAVGIYTADHLSTVTSMGPQTEYAVKVTVSDANSLDNLNTVKVTIFYDADGDDDFSDVPVSGDTQTCAILTWTNPATWAIDPDTDTSWSIEDGNCEAPTLTGGSGDFWFHFKPGKVATEALDWDAYAVADDGGGTPGTRYDSTGYDMNWYGEITVTTDNVVWGSVSPGLDFGDVGSDQTVTSVKYIANGAYDEEVAATDTWTGASGNATLDATGTCDDANEFSLKADDTATLGSAVPVTASPSYVAIDVTDDLGTPEAGTDVDTNTLWLKLAATFVGDTYSGTIYYKIANGS